MSPTDLVGNSSSRMYKKRPLQARMLSKDCPFQVQGHRQNKEQKLMGWGYCPRKEQVG